MSSLKRWLVNLILAVLPPTRCFAFKRWLWKGIGVSVGQQTKINSGARILGGGRVSVGEGSWLGINLAVIVPAGATVDIGSNVDIAPDVLIECGSHEIGEAGHRAGKGVAADVVVGSGTWIGCRVTLLGGAQLGPGTVVAAGAVVLPGEYPENAFLCGVPARVAKILAADSGRDE